MKMKSMLLGFGLLLVGACTSDNLGAESAAVTGAAAGETCAVDHDCQSALECEHGVCAPHGRNRGDAGHAEDGDDHGDHDAGDHDVGDDHGNDGDAGHDVGDDHGDHDAGDHDVGDDHGDDGDAGHEHHGDDHGSDG